VFTDAEVADCTRGGVALESPTGRARLAARFAAKEAARKALGDLRLPFHAVEVRRAPSGAPELHLHGSPVGWSCSLSHDAGIALAVVVGLSEN
jgi:phosphopantetheinyl transferase (holo-ACP synthase)